MASANATLQADRPPEAIAEELELRRERFQKLFGIPLTDDDLIAWFKEHIKELKEDFLFANFNHFRERDSIAVYQGILNGRFSRKQIPAPESAEERPAGQPEAVNKRAKVETSGVSKRK